MVGLGIEVKGKIPANQLAETGRAIAHFTDLGLGQRVRSVVAESASDGEVPADLVAATVRLLAAWTWAQRPTAVVHIGSTRHHELVADLAAKISGIGKIPHLGAVAHLGSSSRVRSNSAHRLKQIWKSYELPRTLAEQCGDEFRNQPLLLVDDYTDTGWTLTVVARLLRQAGAGAVYPCVLGIAG